MYLRGGTVLMGSHLTPASSEWTQLCDPIGLAGQFARRVSVPTQLTLSRKIRPVPMPNRARTIAVLPVDKEVKRSQSVMQCLANIRLISVQ